MFQYQYYSPCGNSSVSLLTFNFSLILLIIPGWNFVAYLMNFISYFGFFLSGGWTHCLAISTAWPRKFVFRISGKLFSDISNLKYSYRKNDKWNCVYSNNLIDEHTVIFFFLRILEFLLSGLRVALIWKIKLLKKIQLPTFHQIHLRTFHIFSIN